MAANGDVLHTTTVSTATIVSPTEFTLRNEITFDGGTGRFANASGTATGHHRGPRGVGPAAQLRGRDLERAGLVYFLAGGPEHGLD